MEQKIDELGDLDVIDSDLGLVPWCDDQVLLLGLETTFREKLEWLEEAETLALRLRKNREAGKKQSALKK